ncbi:MAG: integration host factor subunit alpha [Proteobacteria bacterium]|nr:integration host factor subunit alpha [Pseudomonadota bacterium]
MALTKNDIVDRISELGHNRKKASMLVDSMIKVLKDTLEEGDEILISGFGKFCVKDKNSRRGRNPVTGDEVVLRERRVVTFRCSKKLRNRINGDLETA